MFNDILLPLLSHPKPVSRQLVRKGIDVARVLEAHLTGLVGEPRIPTPLSLHPFGIETEGKTKGMQTEAHKAAETVLETFREEATLAGVLHEERIVECHSGELIGPALEFARMRDLTVVPVMSDDQTSTDLVQELVFDSGRPVLMLPETGKEAFSLEKVVVAWDFTRASTRAIGDAMPLLRRAGQVRVVTISRDKEVPPRATGTEFTAHLARKGVKVTLDGIERGDRSVGETLDIEAADADLLVMGAFGHSRIREFFLGGATKHVLWKPKRPTFLSH